MEAEERNNHVCVNYGFNAKNGFYISKNFTILMVVFCSVAEFH